MKRNGCFKWTSLFLVLSLFAYFMLKEEKTCGWDGYQPRFSRDIDDVLLEKPQGYPKSPRQRDTNSPSKIHKDTNSTNEELHRMKHNEDSLLKYLTEARKNEEDLKKNLIQLSRELEANKNSDKHPSLADSILPTIFVVTPTFRRFVQKAELTRVSQALKPVKNLHWIVVEDSESKTNLVANFLSNSGLQYTHLNVRTPVDLQRHRNEIRKLKPRGVAQRNLGIKWLRRNIDPSRTPGVVYFADDDNTYDSRIFDESYVYGSEGLRDMYQSYPFNYMCKMRWIRGVGVWPVAFTSAVRWAGPVCKNGQVVGFHAKWGMFRPFPIDMAAFAVNIKKLIVDFPKAQFLAERRAGMLESSLLSQITTVKELEPVTANCSKVYVWHTRTEVPRDSVRGERELTRQGKPSNQEIET